MGLALLFAVNSAASPVTHPTPVTLVAIPWATATLDGGAPFSIPATVLLEPGEYRLRVEKEGYAPAEMTLSVHGEAPRNHLIRLVPR